MESQPFNIDFVQNGTSVRDNTRVFMTRVFAWMFAALLVSGLTAFVLGNSASFLIMMLNATQTGLSIFGYAVIFSPMIFSFFMGAGLMNFSYPKTIALLMGFAIVMGASLSTIVWIYTSASILLTFGATAAVFGTMALIGYTTKTDLTKLGVYLGVGVMAIILMSVINMFMGSSMMNTIITSISLIVFTGIAAYHVQMLKNLSMTATPGSEDSKRMAIYGAYCLYITFINLFLTLLRILGDRK